MRALSLACVTLVMLVVAPAARANLLFEVNSTGDNPDTAVGDHLCDANLQTPGDQCTLRAVIQETNHEPGEDGIDFNIPGSGVKTIAPRSVLPAITGPVEINGYTQGTASPNTKALGQGDNAILLVQLSGQNVPLTDGLTLDPGAAGSLIKGLVINRFAGEGLLLRAGCSIEGNFLGTGPDGRVDRGMGVGGIEDFATNVRIGGSTPAASNLISGNGDGGIAISAFGRAAIQGNYIGTQRDGTAPLANAGDGVVLDGNDTTVGGLNSPNVIAFNEGAGVSIINPGQGSKGNSVVRNRIFSNGGLGIDLGGDGRTPNDVGDPDGGANELQNFPSILSAATSGGSVTISGQLQSTGFQRFTLRFFANPPGGTEAATYLAKRSVLTDGTGEAAFIFHLVTPVAVGKTITATATNASGSTSEISAPRTVVAG
jgi:hypothetical protein